MLPSRLFLRHIYVPRSNLKYVSHGASAGQEKKTSPATVSNQETKYLCGYIRDELNTEIRGRVIEIDEREKLEDRACTSKIRTNSSKNKNKKPGLKS